MVALDTKGRQIVKALVINARASIAEISREVGLTENAVRYRIEQLEKEQYIIGYHAELDATKLGGQIHATICGQCKDVADLLHRVKDLPSVVRIYRMEGARNIQLEIECTTLLQLQQFIDDYVLGLGVTEFQTYLRVQRLK